MELNRTQRNEEPSAISTRWQVAASLQSPDLAKLPYLLESGMTDAMSASIVMVFANYNSTACVLVDDKNITVPFGLLLAHTS